MSLTDYDSPENQRVGGADTPDARRWDELWDQLEHRSWDPNRPDDVQVLEGLRLMSSILAEDERFRKVSAKRVFINLVEEHQWYVLNPREDDEEAFDVTQTEIYNQYDDVPLHWLARLLLNSILAPVAALESPDGAKPSKAELSRFDDLRRQAEQVDGLLSYALFLDRARQLFWDDDLVGRVNVKRFIDEIIANLEDPDRGFGKPGPGLDWGWLEGILRGAVMDSDTSMA